MMYNGRAVYYKKSTKRKWTALASCACSYARNVSVIFLSFFSDLLHCLSVAAAIKRYAFSPCMTSGCERFASFAADMSRQTGMWIHELAEGSIISPRNQCTSQLTATQDVRGVAGVCLGFGPTRRIAAGMLAHAAHAKVISAVMQCLSRSVVTYLGCDCRDCMWWVGPCWGVRLKDVVLHRHRHIRLLLYCSSCKLS